MFPCGFVEADVPTDILNLVKRPDYFDLLFRETDKKIVGEEDIRIILINNFLGGRLVKNAKPTSFNGMASSSSGSGKDHITKSILELLPSHYRKHKTRLSPQALSYWHPSDKEPFWTWDGQVLYCEDVTSNFLNSDTLKIMMSGGSDISIVKDQGLIEIKINGSPIFALTSAKGQPNDELNRRVSVFTLDESQEQTEKVLNFQTFQKNEGYSEGLINTAYLLSRVEVFIPNIKELRKQFSKNLYSRTNFPRLLDFIRASCAINQYSRDKNEFGQMISNIEDLKRGIFIFNKLFTFPTGSLTKSQKTLYDYLKLIKTEKSASQIFAEVGFGCYSDISVLIKGLRSLAQKGLVNITQSSFNGRFLDFYSSNQVNPLVYLSYLSPLSHLSTCPQNSKNEGLENNTPQKNVENKTSKTTETIKTSKTTETSNNNNNILNIIYKDTYKASLKNDNSFIEELDEVFKDG